MAIKVIDPNASIALSLRTMAFFLAIRSTPIAKVIVITAGSPSGTAATAKLTAKIKLSIRLLSWIKERIKTAEEATIPMMPICLVKPSSFFCKGVFVSLIVDKVLAIVPNFV